MRVIFIINNTSSLRLNTSRMSLADIQWLKLYTGCGRCTSLLGVVTGQTDWELWSRSRLVKQCFSAWCWVTLWCCIHVWCWCLFQYVFSSLLLVVLWPISKDFSRGPHILDSYHNCLLPFYPLSVFVTKLWKVAVRHSTHFFHLFCYIPHTCPYFCQT